MAEGIVRRSHPCAEPFLLMGIPRTGNVPCRQPAAVAGASELVGAVITSGKVDGIASLIGIYGIGKECHTAVPTLSEGVDGSTFFLQLLVEFGSDGLETAVVEVHTVNTLFAGIVVGTVSLHTSHDVEDMGIVPCIVVLDGTTEVELSHSVAVQHIDTAGRHDGDGERVGFVRILVQVGVAVHDVGVIHTSTVGLCLVRIVQDVVLTVATVCTVATECSHFKTIDRLPRNLTLELDVHHIDVDVVVVKLLEDIEGRIVARIGSVGVERTRSVERVAEGVDIEVTAHLTAHHIHTLVERTGCLLLTVAGIGTHGQRHPLRNLEGGVHVCGITVHLAILGPSGIGHCGERSIEAGLVTTRSDAYGVVVHNIIIKEEVEPVGVAELSLLEVGIHGGLSVGKSELSVGLVVLVDEGIHLSVETGGGTVGKRCQFKPSLLLHLTVDTHLLLRVTDIVLVVVRLATVGKFTGIVDGTVSGTTLLGSDDNHTGHGACTVNRGSATVLEDLETLDVVRVQTCDGIRDKGFGVS